MKKIFLLAAFTGLVYTASAQQPPAGPAAKGNTYGAAINATDAVQAATLPVLLQTGKNVPVKIKAEVLDVCPKKGCWVNLKVNDSTTAFVKMKDYGFFVPVDMKGKTVIIDGEAFLKETSVAELRHYAEDAKKSKEEIAAITAPKKEIRIVANGILVAE